MRSLSCLSAERPRPVSRDSDRIRKALAPAVRARQVYGAARAPRGPRAPDGETLSGLETQVLLLLALRPCSRTAELAD